MPKKTGFANAPRLDAAEWSYLALALRYALANVQEDDDQLAALAAWAGHSNTMPPEKVVRLLSRVYRQGRKGLETLRQTELPYVNATRKRGVS